MGGLPPAVGGVVRASGRSLPTSAPDLLLHYILHLMPSTWRTTSSTHRLYTHSLIFLPPDEPFTSARLFLPRLHLTAYSLYHPPTSLPRCLTFHSPHRHLQSLTSFTPHPHHLHTSPTATSLTHNTPHVLPFTNSRQNSIHSALLHIQT